MCWAAVQLLEREEFVQHRAALSLRDASLTAVRLVSAHHRPVSILIPDKDSVTLNESRELNLTVNVNGPLMTYPGTYSPGQPAVLQPL